VNESTLNLHERLVPSGDRTSTIASREILNTDWVFAYGDDPSWTAQTCETEDWFDVVLPHSFGTPYFMETEFYVGPGVYRRTVALDAHDLEGFVGLEFDGVFQECDVWVNGVAVDSHRGGYTAFLIDVTSACRVGHNALAVRVTNEWDATLPPRAGEHVFNGGIYRDVHLVRAGAVRLAWYGTAISATPTDDGGARVSVDTEVLSDLLSPAGATLISWIEAEESPTVVADRSETSGLLAPGRTDIDQSLHITQARCWDVTDPHQYVLHQQLVVDDAVVEHRRTRFGVRSFEFTADHGFSLNGRRVSIHGANVHQDHAGWADAVTHSGIRRDLDLIRRAGMNFVRGSHYPHHVQFARECDRQGLLFWSEFAFWGIGGESAEGFWSASAYPSDPQHWEAFDRACLQGMAEMIRVNRNSPSIVTWSTGNEVFFTDDAVVERAKELTRRLVELARRLDPTRPASVGGAQRGGFDVLGDLAGYNGDGAALFHDPGHPSLVSEYGSVVEHRPGTFEHRFGYGTERSHDWRSGVVLWCGFHHGSIVNGMGAMGFVDYHRLPLRSYYWYRRHLRGVPPPEWPQAASARGLRLLADATTVVANGTQDVHLTVELVDEEGRVVDDERLVRLEVVDGPAVFPTGRRLELSPLTLSLLEGRGAIELRPLRAGTIRVRAAAHALEPVVVVIEATGGRPWDGRPLRVQPGPPSVRGLNRGGARPLAAKRPTRASSQHPKHPAHHITDYVAQGGWLPEAEGEGSWVRVDLEGVWTITHVRIELADDGVEAPMTVRVDADDAVHTVDVPSSNRTSLDLELPSVSGRSVTVEFPTVPREVKEVRAYGR
jgi:beta-galactosidase